MHICTTLVRLIRLDNPDLIKKRIPHFSVPQMLFAHPKHELNIVLLPICLHIFGPKTHIPRSYTRNLINIPCKGGNMYMRSRVLSFGVSSIYRFGANFQQIIFSGGNFSSPHTHNIFLSMFLLTFLQKQFGSYSRKKIWHIKALPRLLRGAVYTRPTPTTRTVYMCIRQRRTEKMFDSPIIKFLVTRARLEVESVWESHG